MPRTLLLLLTLVLLAACQRDAGRAATAKAGPSGGGTTVQTVESGGKQRSYRLHVPSGLGSGARPLVVSLHGLASSAEQQERVSQMSALADAAGFVVAYPEGLGSPPRWAFGTREEGQADVAFIRAVVADVEARVPIDERRIYVAGISNGAEMSWRLMCDMADVVAAAGLVSGGYPAAAECAPARPVPAIVFHGTADRVLAYGGKPPLMLPVRDWAAKWAAQNGCQPAPALTLQKDEVTAETWSSCRAGADVVLYTISGKGHSWPGSSMPADITTKTIDATELMWAFFAAHPRP